MKRKRGPRAGFKKGKRKQPPVVNDPAPDPVCANAEDTVDLESDDTDDCQVGTKLDIESLSNVPDKVNNKSNTGPDMPSGMSAGKSGHGRVKVKLRSSRISGPLLTYSDAQTHSDTDMSNPQAVLQRHDSVFEKREDSAYSDGQMSDLQTNVSGKSPRKAGSIKIISSKALGSSSAAMQEKHLNKSSSSLQVLGERGPVLSDNENAIDSSVPMKFRLRDTKLPYGDPCYNEKELSTALGVIKKIMKMDAAEPFNAPVNPVALGIPDYFDIIETPMDFGTICQDLECGLKYLNSEDVYKDVQFIWENCYKYNNKGDYIIDLMKRVKKNFMKYWTAAGLYCEIPGATEITQVEDVARSSQEKLHPKGKFSKQKRRRHGIHKHKNGCLCAVCVVRRRRKEREENLIMIDGEMTSNSSLLEDFKQEENSPIDNAGSDPTSSSMGHSPEPDPNADAEETELKKETPDQPENAPSEKQEMSENDMEVQTVMDSKRTSQLLLIGNGDEEDSNQPSQGQESDVGFVIENDDEKGDIMVQQLEEAEMQHSEETEKKQEGSSVMDQQIRIYEDPLHQENHSILQICRSLFPNDPRSVWRAPHSLNHGRQVSEPRQSPIHAAVALLLKQ